jgi:hypothetical protein
MDESATNMRRTPEAKVMGMKFPLSPPVTHFSAYLLAYSIYCCKNLWL